MIVRPLAEAVKVWDKPGDMIADWAVSPSKNVMELLVAHLVGKVGQVADLGCGSGRYADKLDCDLYYGFDYSDAMLDVAKNAGYPKHTAFFGKDVFLESMDRYFDAVLLIDVLQHLEDPVEAVKRTLFLWRADRYIFTILLGMKQEQLLNSVVLEEDAFDEKLSSLVRVWRKIAIPVDGEKFKSVLYEVKKERDW